MNASFGGRFTVYRGKHEITDIGRIIEIDGVQETDTWLSDVENRFRGTDGYFLPPFNNINKPIWSYERQFCISLNLEHVCRKYNRGVPVHRFRGSFDRFSKDPAFCRENGDCPLPGTLDLFNCIGLPIIASLPHFLDAGQ